MFKILRYHSHKESTRSKLAALVLALSVPLSIYPISSTNTAMVMVLFAICIPLTYSLNVNKQKITILFIYWSSIYAALNLLSLLIHIHEDWFNSSSLLNTTLFTIGPFGVIMYWYGRRFSLRYFIRIVTIIAIVGSFIVIYQKLSYLISGDYYKNWFIPGLNLPATILEYKTNIYIDRPSAFFAEPSHFAQFMLPVSLFYIQKRNLLVSIILILGILASGSTNGLVGLAVIFVVAFFLEMKISFKNLFLILSLIVLFVNVSSTDFMSAGLSKVENTDVENYSRVFGSTPVFSKFTVEEWIFGLGQGNRRSFLSYYRIFTGIGDTQDSYINTYFGILSNYGVIGFTAFLWLMITLYKKCTKGATNGYLLLFLALCFSTNMLFDYYMIYYMIFIIFSKELAQMADWQVSRSDKMRHEKEEL